MPLVGAGVDFKLLTLTFECRNPQLPDEYINNITSTVTEAKQTISKDVTAVQDIKDNQNTLFAVQFAGYVREAPNHAA